MLPGWDANPSHVTNTPICLMPQKLDIPVSWKWLKARACFYFLAIMMNCTGLWVIVNDSLASLNCHVLLFVHFLYNIFPVGLVLEFILVMPPGYHSRNFDGFQWQKLTNHNSCWLPSYPNKLRNHCAESWYSVSPTSFWSCNLTVPLKSALVLPLNRVFD